MKRIISFLIATFIMLPFPVLADEIPVYLNGDPLVFDVPPRIINDRTMVPMRKIFETLGASVEWVPEARMIFATKGEACILMQIDVPAMAIKNLDSGAEEKLRLDAAPVIVESRTLVPLRAVSESYGLRVEWKEHERAVYITTQ